MSISEQLDRIENLKEELADIIIDKGAVIAPDADFETMVEVIDEQFGPAIIPDGGTITYYPFSFGEPKIFSAKKCTATIVDADAFNDYVLENAFSADGRFAYREEEPGEGKWFYEAPLGSQEVSLPDIGVDAQLNEGARSAGFNFYVSVSVDKTGEPISLTFPTTDESKFCKYNVLAIKVSDTFVAKEAIKAIQFTRSLPFGGTVGDYFLFNCPELESVSGLSTVNSFGENALSQCAKLVSVDVSPVSVGSSFLSTDPALDCEIDFSRLQSVGAFFMANCTAYSQPLSFNSLTLINGGFLYHCDSVTEVHFGAEGHPSEDDDLSFQVSWNSEAFKQGVTFTSANSTIAQEWTDHLNHSNVIQRANTEYGLPTVYYTRSIGPGLDADSAVVDVVNSYHFIVSWGDGTFGSPSELHRYTQGSSNRYIKLIPTVENAQLYAYQSGSYSYDPAVLVCKEGQGARLNGYTIHGIAVGDVAIGEASFAAVSVQRTRSGNSYAGNSQISLNYNILFKNTLTTIPDAFFVASNSSDGILRNGHTFEGIDWSKVEEIGDKFLSITNGYYNNSTLFVADMGNMPRLKRVGNYFLSAIGASSFGASFSGFNYPELETVGTYFMSGSQMPPCTINLPKLKSLPSMFIYGARKFTGPIYVGALESADSTSALCTDTTSGDMYYRGVDVYCATQALADDVATWLPNSSSLPYRKLKIYVGTPTV